MSLEQGEESYDLTALWRLGSQLLVEGPKSELVDKAKLALDMFGLGQGQAKRDNELGYALFELGQARAYCVLGDFRQAKQSLAVGSLNAVPSGLLSMENELFQKFVRETVFIKIFLKHPQMCSKANFRCCAKARSLCTCSVVLF